MKEKIIVELCGGLGNQIYQYALFLYLRQNGKKCYLHPNKKYLKEFGGLSLTKVFPRSKEYLSTNLLVTIYSSLYYGLSLFRGLLNSRLPSLYAFLASSIHVREIMFPQWDNYSFLDQISNKSDLFLFKEMDKKNRALSEEMVAAESVSIHIRRGDYQKVKKWRIGVGDICDEQYYLDAIRYVKGVFNAPKFYVFSDDIEWVKDNLHLEDVQFIDWNTGEDSYKDMQLMTFCKANICANSTFSLIGAWLNVNPKPLVIVPKKWDNNYIDKHYPLYVPTDSKNWITINNKKPQVSIVYHGIVNSKNISLFLSQTFSDFEVLCNDIDSIVADSRFKNSDKPLGNFVFELDDINKLKDNNFVRSWLLEQYIDSI